MEIFTGWFFLYRGNGYGPYDTWDDALGMFRCKHGCSPNRAVHPVYGTAQIKDKELIEFKRDYSAEKKKTIKKLNFLLYFN